MKKQLLLALFTAALGFPCLGSFADLDFGSKTDLWDIRQGTVVTSISGRANSTMQPENMFGGTASNTDGLPAFIFQDGQPAGYIHFVEWKTPAPVTIASAQLRGQGDGPAFENGREFAKVRLLAKSPGSSTFDQVLFEYTPEHPYSFEDYDTRLLVTAHFLPVTAQEYRAEFTDTGVRFWSAPRIWEIDGFGVPFDFGSKSDLWDTSQGTVVTKTSGRANDSFRAEDMFGAVYPNTDDLPDFIFEDGQPAGYVHFIEWKTLAPVLVRSFRLHAQGDGPEYLNGREFDHFKLLAKSPGSSTFDKTLYDFTPSHPYTFEDYDVRLALSASVSPTTAQEFRAEFVDTGVRFWSAPRIFELDGFTEPNQANVKAFVAVELAWQTKAGRRYQLQWKESLNAPDWKNYGDPFDGTGGSSSFLLSTRDQSSRLFRLVELP